MNRKILGLAFVSGFLFSVGLGISGMTQPSKVFGFLDIFGAWDPALMGVMGGGILVAAIFYRRVIRRDAPIFAETFQVPSLRSITPSLVVGSGLFGIGWGIAGYCPGPAVTSLVTGSSEVLIFTGAMIAGMLLFRLTERLFGSRAELEPSPVAGAQADA